MSRKRNYTSILSIILTICMIASLVPNVFAAQSNEYTDPAEVWLSSNNRTNERDVNATTTYENYKFTQKLLKKNNLNPKSFLIVGKPYQEFHQPRQES